MNGAPFVAGGMKDVALNTEFGSVGSVPAIYSVRLSVPSSSESAEATALVSLPKYRTSQSFGRLSPSRSVYDPLISSE